jgi:adenylate kinase family enzyme
MDPSKKKPKRVVVIGNSCVGKTTFSSRLAAMIGATHIELDALFWEPNWKEADNEVFRSRVFTALNSESWVIDGNYARRIKDIVWPKAEILVWLDLPLHLILRRFIVRSLNRSLTGKKLWGHSQETLRNNIFSRNSLLVWILKSHRRNATEFSKLATNPMQGLTVHHLRSKTDVTKFLNSFEL